MNFFVSRNAYCDVGAEFPAVVLVEDDWDDWFKFNTMYSVFIAESNTRRRPIGSVKIGQFNMQPQQRRPDIGTSFQELDERFFSLGQDDNYYDKLNKNFSEIRELFLGSLRDLAFISDEEFYDLALSEEVSRESLLRSVASRSIRTQFRRIALGGARLSPFNFQFTLPQIDVGAVPVVLQFDVRPESQPPTNVHVLIGSNGVGKTRLLRLMSRAFIAHLYRDDDEPQMATDGEQNFVIDQQLFANIVLVTFSAFDPFEPLINDAQNRTTNYSYIGLKVAEDVLSTVASKTPEMLAKEFGISVGVCRQSTRRSRWRKALGTLESDPIFAGVGIAELTNSNEQNEDFSRKAENLFAPLSSGHKIVLLTITRLVETVTERTLVLLDEPEAHLHPPLLSAFVRALSDLLVDRNGVAIIATHSPVILQEVPSSNVWKLRRSGESTVAERPEVETFGENVGTLTHEVFGLEVKQSGFHKLLSECVEQGLSYQEVLDTFGGELGAEAKAIVRALIASRDEANS
jgi:hypothetical protein